MKLVGIISTAVLSLTLGVAAPAFAQEQHDQQEEKAKPAQEEKKAQPEKSAKPEEKPTAKQEEKPAAQEEKNNKQAEKNTQQEEKNTKQEQKNAQQQDKNTKQEDKNAQQRAEQGKPGQEQRAAGGRIPDERFKANFGRQHTFHVSQAEYSGGRRFQYGGYWFGFVDSWPSNWLYTQDVYVVDINGVYYLCNPSYPGVNIALSVTL